MSAALCIVPAWAQASQFEEFHTWTDVRTIKNFSERFRYDGATGFVACSPTETGPKST